MSVISVVARIALAVALIFSAATKIRDPGWPSAAKELGVPLLFARLVVPTELVLGALLAAGIGVLVLSWLAFGLLVLFSLVLMNAFRKPIDERPRCACFGNWSSRPVSIWSLVRNTVLSTLAVLSALTG